MSSKTSRAAHLWAIMIIVTMILMNSIVVAALAVSMMTDEEPSVVRANTTNEVSPKADMPEISIEDLEATLVMYSAKPEEVIEEPITEYVIQSGDTLWSIAENIYGDGSYYPYLMKNNDIDSETIREGQILTIEYFDDTDAETILDECYQYTREHNKKSTSSSAKNYSTADEMTYVGNYKITGYNPWCAHCCGKSDGITASGTQAKVGRTIAAKGFSYGTKLYIEGYGTYIVEDNGGFKDNVIDVAANSHDDCFDLTGYNVPVYIVY